MGSSKPYISYTIAEVYSTLSKECIMSNVEINFEALETQLKELEASQASLLEVSKTLAKSVIDALLWYNRDEYAMRLCKVVPAFRNIIAGIFGNTVRMKPDSITVLAPTQAKLLYQSFRSETKLNWDLALQYFAEAKAEKAEKAKAERNRKALNATDAEIISDIKKAYERLQKRYPQVNLRDLWDKI